MAKGKKIKNSFVKFFHARGKLMCLHADNIIIKLMNENHINGVVAVVPEGNKGCDYALGVI